MKMSTFPHFCRRSLALALLAVALLAWSSVQAGTPDQTPATPMVSLPDNAAEVLKLHDAKISDDTIRAFIANSGSTYTLTADQIIYLQEHGLSSELISAMLTQGRAATSPAPAPAPTPASAASPATPATSATPSVPASSAPATSAPAPAASTPPPTTTYVTTPAPTVTYVQPAPATVTYYYPAYSADPYPYYYPYAYYPPVSFSIGWGWGWHGDHGWHGGSWHGGWHH